MKKETLGPKTSRREFIGNVSGAVAGVALLGGGLGWSVGCGSRAPSNVNDPAVDAASAKKPDPSLLVRHDVTSAEGLAMLEIYRRAVEVMKERPDQDPTSWRAQAQIHRDHCPHGNAYFLPWHRAYIHHFEQIVRQAAEEPSFTLPYWNWSTTPALPDGFWQGSLDDPTRRIQAGEEIPERFVGQQVIDDILAIADFETFASAYVKPECGSDQRASCGSGRLESTPHNNVHTEIGGRSAPVGHMSTFLSPIDPIFWLHHCNVDRLWAEWNQQHANGDDADWRAWVFVNNFVDAEGQPHSPRVEELLDTADLGYRFDTISEFAPQADLTGGTAVVLASAEASNTAAATAEGPISIPLEVGADLRGLLGGFQPEAAGPRTVRLTVGGVEPPSAAIPVNIYLGPPDLPTAGVDSRSYVATVSFFPVGGHGEQGHAHGSNTFLFDVSDMVIGDERFESGEALHVHVEPEALDTLSPQAAGNSITPSVVRLEVLEHA